LKKENKRSYVYGCPGIHTGWSGFPSIGGALGGVPGMVREPTLSNPESLGAAPPPLVIRNSPSKVVLRHESPGGPWSPLSPLSPFTPCSPESPVFLVLLEIQYYPYLS